MRIARAITRVCVVPLRHQPDFVLDGKVVPRRHEDECAVLCLGAELTHLARPT